MDRFKQILHPSNRKKNPYDTSINPHQAASHPNAGRTRNASSAPRLPSLRFSGAFLAEARQVGGWDPVTGRLVTQHQHSDRELSHQDFGRSSSLGAHDGSAIQDERSAYGNTALQSGTGTRYDLAVQKMQTGAFPAPDEEVEESAKRSAYGNSAAKAGTGTKYDLFVRQMQERKKREEEERVTALARDAMREPVGGYYAPSPRTPMEYYGSG